MLSKWVNSLLSTEKPAGKLALCLGPAAPVRWAFRYAQEEDLPAHRQACSWGEFVIGKLELQEEMGDSGYCRVQLYFIIALVINVASAVSQRSAMTQSKFLSISTLSPTCDCLVHGPWPPCNIVLSPQILPLSLLCLLASLDWDC